MNNILLVSLAVHFFALVVETQPVTLRIAQWFWFLILGALSISLMCAMFGRDAWLHGVAAAGLLMLIQRLSDLLLVACDAAKVYVLSRSPRIPR